MNKLSVLFAASLFVATSASIASAKDAQKDPNSSSDNVTYKVEERKNPHAKKKQEPQRLPSVGHHKYSYIQLIVPANTNPIKLG
ncbi:MAG: hypothetical protein WC477_01550 [Patescibacteria group bacterium]